MNQYETSDLALAAYLTFQGLSLVSAKKLPTGRFQFILDDPDGKADTLSLGSSSALANGSLSLTSTLAILMHYR